MKFVSFPGTPPDRLTDADRIVAERALRTEYRTGRGIGSVTLGTRHLFFQRFRTVYCLPYERISRYFRRVEVVPARIGCCGGELEVEHLVLCTAPDNRRERELVQIPLPGAKAGRLAMAELVRLAPQAVQGCPARKGARS